MPNRGLKESILTSDSLDRLSAEAERLFYRLLVVVDDYGWTYGDLRLLLAACFPLRASVFTCEQMRAWATELLDQKIIELYEYQGREYVHFTEWQKHNTPRAAKSKYLIQSNLQSANRLTTFASSCTQLHADAPVLETRDKRLETRDKPPLSPPKVTAHAVTSALFTDFWVAYPNKVAKAQAQKTFMKLSPEHQQAAVNGIGAWLAERELRRKAGGFVPELPNPSTWLNGHRWDDRPAPAELGGGNGRHGAAPKTNNTPSQAAAMDYEALEARFPGQFTEKARLQREARERSV